jgi:hypothetical protein
MALLAIQLSLLVVAICAAFGFKANHFSHWFFFMGPMASLALEFLLYGVY